MGTRTVRNEKGRAVDRICGNTELFVVLELPITYYVISSSIKTGTAKVLLVGRNELTMGYIVIWTTDEFVEVLD